MHFIKNIAFTFSLLALVTFSSPAKALDVPYDASTIITDYTLQGGALLSDGDEGDLTFLPQNAVVGAYNDINLSGLLAANSKITFTFSAFAYNPQEVGIGAYGSVNTTVNGLPYQAYVSSYDSDYGYGRTGGTYSDFFLDGNPTDIALLFASAQMDDANYLESTSYILNISDAAAMISSIISLTSMGIPGAFINVHYNVSAVPIPAALPLFGLGLAGLAGIRSRRKKIA